jgi:hypothetical protein
VSISLTCDCGKQFRAKDETAGRSVVCPACKKTVPVPETFDGAEESEISAADPGQVEKRRGSGSNLLTLAGVAMLAFAAGLVVGHFALPPRTESSANEAAGLQKQGAETSTGALITSTGAMIKAEPNPVPAGTEKGKTTISWDTGDNKIVGVVYVVTTKGEEKRFSGNGAKGSQEANWIGKGEYEFRLYAEKERKTLLASVKVTRNKE